MEGCFSEGGVLRLLDGRLTPIELQIAEQHLDGCADCRALVAATAAIMPAGARDAATDVGGPTGEDELPRRIGRYLVRAKVGSGGMGTVYAAFDPQLGRRVALKLLRPDIGHGQASRARLVREAQAMARLQHANVVTVHDLGVVGEQLYIAMELVDGLTLGQWLRQAERDWRDIVRTFVAAGRGLEAAHGAGIVHRDFKPENVLVATNGGAVRVTDFGVARMTADSDVNVAVPNDAVALDTSLTASGMLLGTPVYMAPEQLMGDPVDARADIFSFCATLYEALYRQRPFSFHSLAELRAAVCKGDVRPPPPGRAVPDALWRLIQRGLAVDREARYPSLAPLLSALEEQLERAQRRPRRPTWIVLTAAALGLVAVGALGVGGYFLARPRVSRDWTQPLWQRRAIASAVTGDVRDGALARVLDERLRQELALGGELRVVPADRVERVRAELGGVDFASVDRAGRALLRDRLGCQLLLAGHARTQPDGMVQLTVEVRDAVDGRPRAWAEDSAPPDALDPLTVELSARLRQQLALQPPSADDEAREHAAFPATPALAQQFAEGLAALRRFDADGARRALEAVVAADPQQPLAWAALAEAWRQLGYQQRQHEAAKQAFDRAGSLPREQRLWVEAQAREANREWPEAIELYRTLASFFPDNLEYGLRLAQAQLTGGHAADADATLTRLAKLPPPDGNDPRIDLVRASARSRDSDYAGALTLLDGAQQRAQAVDQRQLLASIRQLQCQVLHELVRTQEAIAACADAERLFAAAGDRVGVAGTILSTAQAYMRAERYGETDAQIERALAAYHAVGSDAGAGRALLALGIAYTRAAKLKEGIALEQKAADLFQGVHEPYLTVFALQDLAAAQTNLGDFTNATKNYEATIALARQIDLPDVVAEALGNYANLLNQEARPDEAQRAAEQSIALYHQLKDPPDIAYAYDPLGKALLDLDKLPEARQAFEAGLKARESVGWAGGSSRQNLAEEAMDEGQVERAETLARKAFDEQHARHMGLAEAYSGATLAEILFHEGKTKEALKIVDDVAAILKASGSDFAANGLLQLDAETRAARGEVAEARRELRDEIARNEQKGALQAALWTRLTLAEIEVGHGAATARQTLAEVARMAPPRHMRLVARKAAELARKGHGSD